MTTKTPARDLPPPWAALALPDRLGADRRTALVNEIPPARADGGGRLVIHTCHRVEWYGGGEPDTKLAATPGVRVLRGADAAAHLFRLAAGLESAVLGEEQVLAQVRTAHREAAARGLDAAVDRLAQLAMRIGRAARAGGIPGELRDLAALAIDRLGVMTGPLAGRRVLVVGSGAMGTGLVRAAAKRGARITVGGRDAARAGQVARIASGSGVDLAEAARVAPGMDAVVVALAGPWLGLPDDARLPPTVDLSSPSALPSAVRDRLGVAFIDIDTLAPDAAAGPRRHPGEIALAEREYVDRAERLVADALGEYERWYAARTAVRTVRELRTTAEARRAAEVDRLLRRLPELDERQRELVELMSRRLVGSILHAPLARLRDDPDEAETIRRTFAL